MFRLCRMILFGSFLLISGCGVLVTGSPEEDDHEDHHLEHHVPAHRPSDFTNAVDQIEERFKVMSQSANSESASSTELAAEFSDILNWLPEIAADSDMRRKDWEEVDALSSQLIQEFEDWRGLGLPGESPKVKSLRDSIDQLKGLRGKEHPAR